jgi:hypothetical protein
MAIRKNPPGAKSGNSRQFYHAFVSSGHRSGIEMKLADQFIHSISWRLYRYAWGIAVVRAVRWVVPLVFPYRAPESPVSQLALHPRYRVEAAPSTVEGAGTGLFSRESIPAGEVVGEYGGDLVDTLLRWLRLRNRDYLMNSDIPTVMVDAANRPDLPMRYVNHHFNPSCRNLVRTAEGGKVFFVSSREIAAGEELFVDYGALYWKLRGVDPERDFPGAT